MTVVTEHCHEKHSISFENNLMYILAFVSETVYITDLIKETIVCMAMSIKGYFHK